jgi:hypothetical protein
MLKSSRLSCVPISAPRASTQKSASIVIEAPCDRTREPIDDGAAIHKALRHRDLGDIGRPELAKEVAIRVQTRNKYRPAAYWLKLTVRDAIPKPHDLAKAGFAASRLRLIETAQTVCLAFAVDHPEAGLFASLRGALAPVGA